MTIEELEVLAKSASQLLPIVVKDGQDYAEATGPQFQAMTMQPDAFIALNELLPLLPAIAARMRELEGALKPLIERYEKRKTLFGEYPNDAGEIMVNCKDLRRARATLQQEPP